MDAKGKGGKWEMGRYLYEGGVGRRVDLFGTLILALFYLLSKSDWKSDQK